MMVTVCLDRGDVHPACWADRLLIGGLGQPQINP